MVIGGRHYRNTLALAFCLLWTLAAGAQHEASAKRTGAIEALPRDLEIQLALSSLPAHLRDQATVYVLNPQKGYEVARKGTNGFSALVARSDDDAFKAPWPLTAFPDDILIPISWDQAGASAHLRVFLDIAEMQAKGMPPGEVRSVIQQRYQTKVYKAPERAGVSYMLSPILRTYTNPDVDAHVATSDVPHIMYYAPNVSDADVGATRPSPEAFQHGRWQAAPYPFVVGHGPHAYNIQFLGVTETAAITKEYEEMLGRLCKIKDAWCLPK
jgi:hypothetical protein